MDIEELYRKYQRPLFSYAYRLTRHREIAEDLVQEAFLQAMRYLQKRKEKLGLPWFERVVKNLFYNQYKRDKRIIFETDMYDKDIIKTPDKTNIEKEIEIEDELKKLTKRERAVVERKRAGWKHREIAEELHCTKQNISYILKQVRRKLNFLLDK